MSIANLYIIAKAFPALLVLPVLHIPVLNGICLRIGADLIQHVCLKLPIYMMSTTISILKKFSLSYSAKEKEADTCHYIVFETVHDPDFPEYESIEMY